MKLLILFILNFIVSSMYLSSTRKLVMNFNNYLTKDERRLFDLLTESIRYNKKNTVARVAGGWVRDKLLGRTSDDIDIALDNQSGEEFANNVNNYLQSRGANARHIAVIQANPEQSKHLQTATLKVLNFELDCVNLRAETYAADSRIPEIRFGTAKEDAMRRDFTINALFYNLNTCIVEDLTEYGLQDLEKGLIRTPLSPMITFKDDPLRVLRAIRFASRYYFILHPDIITAAQHLEIKQALREKVSRERVLKEFDGMFGASSSRPMVALHLVNKLTVWDSIFLLPKDLSLLSLRQDTSHPVNILKSSLALPFISVDMEFLQWKIVSMETARWCNIVLSLYDTIHKTHTTTTKDVNTSFTINTDKRKVAVTRETSTDSSNIRVYIPGVLEDNSASTTTTTTSTTTTTNPSPVFLYQYIQQQQQSSSSITIPSSAIIAPRGGSFRSLFWAASTSGFNRLQYFDKKKYIYYPSILLLESLKSDIETTKQVQCLHETAYALRDLLESMDTSYHPLSSINLSTSEKMSVIDESNSVTTTTTTTTTTTVTTTATSSINNTVIDRILNHIQDTQVLIHDNDIAQFRMRAGMIMRDMITIYNIDKAPMLWRHALLLACAEDLSKVYIHEHNLLDENNIANYVDTSLEEDVVLSPIMIDIIVKYSQLQRAIEILGLHELIWDLKPLLDGNQIIEMLKYPKGPWITAVMKEQIKWQLLYPEGNSAELITYLREYVRQNQAILMAPIPPKPSNKIKKKKDSPEKVT